MIWAIFSGNIIINAVVVVGLICTSLMPSLVYLHTLLPLAHTTLVATDVGPISSSLRVLSVDVIGESVAVTLAFDVRYMVLLK